MSIYVGLKRVFAFFRALQNGEQGWEEGELDAGDGWEAQEAVFDLGGESGVGGLVGGGELEGDAGEVAGGEVGDGGAEGVGIEGEGGGADEVGVDDVALGAGGVAVAEESEEVGVGHGWWWRYPLISQLATGTRQARRT
jgi:hypothetical protein